MRPGSSISPTPRSTRAARKGSALHASIAAGVSAGGERLRRTIARAAAVTLLCATAGTTIVVPASAASRPRALWVWDTADIRHDPAARREFFTFLAAPHGSPDRAITTLFFSGLSETDLAKPGVADEMRAFLKEAHRRRLHVEFLCGDASWAQAKHRSEALAYLQSVLTFNKASASDSRFDGFQFDVEPYLLKEWPNPELRGNYLALLSEARDMIRASKSRLVLGAAIPRFFGLKTAEFLDRPVLDRLDYVALMDYVDSAERFVNDAGEIVGYAGRTGKYVWLGAETQELKEEPTATFFALGKAAMEQAFAAAAGRYKNAPGFKGVAVHHWNSYRDFAR